jgi:UDP-GlcNAc:undecaprenyl-phosphate GlcNAc-1-phosphate transferase
MIAPLILAGAIALVISWSAGFFVRRFAPRCGLVDRPGHRKVHTTPTPLGGGLAIWLGVVLPLAAGTLYLLTAAMPGAIADMSSSVTDQSPGVSAGLSSSALNNPDGIPSNIAKHFPGLRAKLGSLWLFLGLGTILVVLGLLDDRQNLDWRLRMFVQTGVAVAAVASGWRLSLFIDVPWITWPLSVLWIVGLINSFNMLDNMDGLSGGVAAIAASFLAAVMLLAPDPATNQPQLFVAGFLLLLVGSLLGFLWHNRPPARLFMGDAGAYFVGFCLAISTINATFAGGDLPAHAVLAPLCVLAIPIYDTVTVIAIRLRRGLSPFHGDKNHFSHRLVDLGFSKVQAVLVIYLATATTGLSALLLHQVNATGAVIILLLVACVLTLVGLIELTARRRSTP